MRKPEVEKYIEERNHFLSNVIGVACLGLAISCQGTSLKALNSMSSLLFIFLIMWATDYRNPFMALRKKKPRTKREDSALKTHDQIVHKNLVKGVPFLFGSFFLLIQVVVCFFLYGWHDYQQVIIGVKSIVDKFR